MRTSLPISPRQHAVVRATLILAYMAGIVGLQLPALSGYFRPLSPLTLIGSLLILLLYHTDWRLSFYVYAILAVLTGYFVEVLGVHTSLVFGHYAYGRGLGPTLWGVPPVIGLNWLTLSYCCGSVVSRFNLPRYAEIILAASMMVVLDFFIEPVAVELDFWTWFGQPVPLQNYVGWWTVSLVLFSLWFYLPFQKENRLAKWVLGLQFLFFICHNLFMVFH